MCELSKTKNYATAAKTRDHWVAINAAYLRFGDSSQVAQGCNFARAWIVSTLLSLVKFCIDLP